MKSVKSAVVLVIDRLGAGWLSPYGNTWLDGQDFNRLAARSLLCETVIADSPELARSYRSLWTGQHATEAEKDGAATIAALAQAAGGRSVLLTDDLQVGEHSLASGFGERRVLSVSEGAKGVKSAKSATQIEQTQMFAFFDAAQKAVREFRDPGILWLHSRGMSGPWDAPLELRYQFADEEDPEPPSFVDPPEFLLREGYDPDEVLGIVQAYAGQVALADMCLGLLFDALDEHPRADELLFVLTSPRGYPLGEHRTVGARDAALYGELLQVPLLVRFPGDEQALARSRMIVQPSEVFQLISEACGWGAEGRSQLWGEMRGENRGAGGLGCAVSQAGEGLSRQRAIRTSAWFMRESREGEEVRRELFAKPDDRWEANDVSSRCGEVTELLAAELDRFEVAAGEGRLAESAPLAEVLCDVWR